jgi:putative salt-induced outer membrane protein YdiY
MKIGKEPFLLIAGILAASLLKSTAQPTVVTVTNYVTVVVTNVVTITNVVASGPPATAAGASPAPKLAPTNSWQSSISAGLSLTRGNSDSMLFSADFLTKKKTPTDEYGFRLGGSYGDQNSKETVNNYKVAGQWNHFFIEQFFSYLRADGLRDVIADLDYRFTIGPGAGYYLIKQTNTTLAAEVGAAFEAQKLGGQDVTFATVRLAERFERKLNDHVRLWENVEFLPQVEQFDNYVVTAEIGVETSLTKTLSLKTYLNDSYQNQPAKGKEKNDAKIIAAVAYKF